MTGTRKVYLNKQCAIIIDLLQINLPQLSPVGDNNGGHKAPKRPLQLLGHGQTQPVLVGGGHHLNPQREPLFAQPHWHLSDRELHGVPQGKTVKVVRSQKSGVMVTGWKWS